jgi:hypothetical protein
MLKPSPLPRLLLLKVEAEVEEELKKEARKK